MIYLCIPGEIALFVQYCFPIYAIYSYYLRYIIFTKKVTLTSHMYNTMHDNCIKSDVFQIIYNVLILVECCDIILLTDIVTSYYIKEMRSKMCYSYWPYLVIGYIMYILRLQKRAIRTISLNLFKAHTNPLLKSINLLDIMDIYQLKRLKLYYKVKNSLIPSDFTKLSIYNRNNVHTSRYALRNKRVNIAIHPK